MERHPVAVISDETCGQEITRSTEGAFSLNGCVRSRSPITMMQQAGQPSATGPRCPKLGKERLFNGQPIELPLSFHNSHPYVIEFHDGTLLRFASLLCAARSGADYDMPVVDQAKDKRYTPAECKRIADFPTLAQVNLSQSPQN